jgi:hypothetical protein
MFESALPESHGAGWIVELKLDRAQQHFRVGFLARASGQEAAGFGRGNELIGRNVGARQREKRLGAIGVGGSRLFPDLQGSLAVAVAAQADAQQIEVLR